MEVKVDHHMDCPFWCMNEDVWYKGRYKTVSYCRILQELGGPTEELCVGLDDEGCPLSTEDIVVTKVFR